MNHYFRVLSFFLILLLSVISCFAQTDDFDLDKYKSNVNAWHARRIKALQKDTSWLTLAGLYWLDPGENTFGSDDSNKLVFPQNAPPFLGKFILNDSTVSVDINEDVEVMHDSSLVTQMELAMDISGDPTVLEYGSLIWYVIQRDDKFGIRLKDKQHPNLLSFKGIARFPIDPKWRIKAKLEPYDSAKTIHIPNVLGQVEESPCPGALVFEIEGKTYRLDPIDVKSTKRYWLIFADETNGEETYGAGRFLYCDAVDETGYTYIDFNESYNPPCIFSPYATCPLPPKQNRLALPVTAGEKTWEGAHH